MTNKMYDEIAIERQISDRFGVDVEIMQAVLLRAPVSHTAEATLFLSTKKQLYLYIHSKSKILLGDVKKIVSRMGLKAELYIPPKGRQFYFEEVGRSKFLEVFPGRKNIGEQDLIFYRTLAPYNPALVLISEVKDGEVYQFDSDSRAGWRIGVKFAYRRIKTS
ncbi:MAG: hypothetical protein PHO93_02580 [Candidatus Saccharimonadaceae bacterium]|nr:hypothetical protein [Candidatus Saccharimonadaceae bacterium]